MIPMSLTVFFHFISKFDYMSCFFPQAKLGKKVEGQKTAGNTLF